MNWKNFVPLLKLLVYDRLTHSVAVYQMPDVYPKEYIQHLRKKELPSERNIWSAREDR
jgi:hypothetical protein